MADKKPQTESEMEDMLMKLNQQRRKSSVGGSSIKPQADGVEWNPEEHEMTEEFMKKAAQKMETERRHSRGFDDDSFK